MSLKSLTLKNFKQFENFSVSCREVNILVGPNNAGKSTTLDALRICSDVLRYATRRKPLIASQDDIGVCATYVIDHQSIGINIENVVRDYRDEDAEIKLVHRNGNTLIIRIHPEHAVKAFFKTQDSLPRSSAQIAKAFPLSIVITPTLGPLEGKEGYVTDETVKRNENTRLAHRTFRNIWMRKNDDEFSQFSALIKEAWPKIEIGRPELYRSLNPVVQMFYIEERITREVFWAGFGFQVWMQMMTQVLRGSPDAILVLDEPDIYLHPDLQRRLVRIIKRHFGQIFLATHSSEIINEVNAGDILSINSKSRNARRISSEDGYRDIFNYIGSSENAEFARMARARRVVFFEGKDRKILRKFAQKATKAELLEDPDTVFLQAGGFGQWRRVQEVGWTLENVFGMDIKVSALFDRDYRCDAEIKEFIAKISAPGIQCHVLGRKEIENYALEETALVRTIQKRFMSVGKEIEEKNAKSIIDNIFNMMYLDVNAQKLGNFLSFKKKNNPKLNEATIIAEGMSIFNAAWEDRARRYSLVPGKEFISVLSAKMHEVGGVSVTISQIQNEMRASEVSSELIHIITEMENFFKS